MIRKTKIALFTLADLLFMIIAWMLSFVMMRLEFVRVFTNTYYYLIIDVFLVYVIFNLFGLYNNIMKYMGFSELLKMIASVLIIMACNFIFTIIAIHELDIHWAFTVSIIFAMLVFLSRFFYCFYDYMKNVMRNNRCSETVIRTLIVGAGDAGSMLIKELQNSDKVHYCPVCALDDDENKIGQTISGIRVVGKISEVMRVSKQFRIDEIIVAMPSVNGKRRSEIIKECQKTSCKVMTVPGLYQLVEGELTVNAIKDVSIQDLLGREQVKVNLDEIMGYIENKTVLITGGGGSIGSELCRQIAGHNPKRLIIVDIYENNAYDIQQELLRRYPELDLVVQIASVRDSNKMNKLFEYYKPNIVFHAAAHKHVPLMETCPNEAVKNNVSGTFKVASAAGRNGAEKFILISTDKAVNPTNIMGATKRICEMIIQAMNNKYDTDYVAVRFGNVLGSNGSVIPLFRKQIEEGGPVTVTHKDIVRYFMTIPEAVSLVLQAGAYAKGGEIFVLDMGEPVRIYDLALNMIKLSGLEPYKDIDIKIVGLRPGEKLYEERLMEEEGLQKTANAMISIGKPLKIDEDNLFEKIQELYVEAYNETDKMKQLVHELVPTYRIDAKTN